MSNLINDVIKENIAEEVVMMAEDNIWNVINAIVDDFGIDKLPRLLPGRSLKINSDAMIDALINLRFEEKLVWMKI